MSRILLIGRNGQVGWELQRTLAPLGELHAVGRETVNLTQPDRVRHLIREFRPSVIVNAAAYTEVDKAESEASTAMAVNANAPGVMAEEAKRLGALLVHYSTDYVFDGNKGSAYIESDQPSPINAYGQSKLEGEHAVAAAGAHYLIFRCSWIYGIHGRNFVRTIRRLAGEREELRIVSDQFGTPTWSRMIAEATASVLAQYGRTPADEGARRDNDGLYHMASGGSTSWFGFAERIIRSQTSGSESRLRLTPIRSDEYHTAAARPRYSVLQSDRLHSAFGVRLPDWTDGFDLFFKQPQEQAYS